MGIRNLVVVEDIQHIVVDIQDVVADWVYLDQVDIAVLDRLVVVVVEGNLAVEGNGNRPADIEGQALSHIPDDLKDINFQIFKSYLPGGYVPGWCWGGYPWYGGAPVVVG